MKFHPHTTHSQAPGELTETIDSGSSPEYRALQEHRVMRNARAAPKQAEQHAAEQVGDADGPDLVARGMGWEETVKTCREGVEQAGFSWDKVSPMALNIMQRVANAAHKAGFELGKQRALAAVPKQDAHHARLYRFLRESTPLAMLQFIAVHSDTPEEFDAALTAYMVKHEAALSRLNPARHPGAPEAPQGELF